MDTRDLKTTWDLSPLFSSDNDENITKEREKVREATKGFIKKWKDNISYLEDSSKLKEALDDYENWNKNFGPNYKELYYFSCRSSQDQTNTEVRAKSNQANEEALKIQNEMEFFPLSLGTITPENQKKFLNDTRLKDYHYFLKRIFIQAKYFLSEKEEKIINLKNSTSYENWAVMTSTFLSKESRIVLDEDESKSEKSFEELMTLISSRKKDVRDCAAKALNEILEKYSDVAEHEINSILQDKKVNDDLRGYERPDSSRHIGDGIESEIVDCLVDSVSKRNDISARFYKLKASLLNVSKLAYYERNVDYGSISKKYSYEESIKLVSEVFKQIDSEFSEILSSFINNGQIDVYPKKGKRGGAYCAHGLLNQPTYILLNYTSELNDILTIAHEVGHGINNELMRKKQNALNFDSSLAIAEVASTFMENFVLDEILKEADDELRLIILVHKIGGDISTIQRQVACYRFESELHTEFRKKGYLSKKEIGDIFVKNMNAYMGDCVEQSPGAENWWVYWSHIRTPFYVYSYASGLLIAQSLQGFVKKDKNFVSKVKDILSAGESDSPKNIFANAGIDITKKEFWNEGLKEMECLLVEAEELAKKLGKV
ncbi:M3 family oligoendopeptidase [bacterium]|nr:M3 family oligoendopeptidase [bacterium]